MTAYATESDVYKFGLPRGALGNPGRVVDSSLAATSTITLGEHGFAIGDAITFQVTEGGVLSAPLVAGVAYYALPLTDSTFKVSATPNGSPITLTTDGTAMIATTDLPFADLLEFYSRFVDGCLPAHVVPLPADPVTGLYPITVRGVVAQLVAKRVQIISGAKSESMDDTEKAAKAQIERWANTLPARDAVNAVPANLAISNNRPHEYRLGRPLFGMTADDLD